MTDAPNSPALPQPCPADEADWARAYAMRRLEMLGELAELGLDVARAVERQASDPSAPQVVPGDVALAYARVSRAVRLTLMLQAKLIEDMKASEEASGEARVMLDPVNRTKARVHAIVDRVALSQHPDEPETRDRLLEEAADHLDDEDLYGDLLEYPLSTLVARLCKDLGLEPDWAELAEELWAVREVESGEVGWPLAGLNLRTTSPTLGRGRGEPSAEEPMVERAGGCHDAASSPHPNSS
jgi:hypothetical protein